MSGIGELEPFDPADPLNIACEHFRKGFLKVLLDADRITVFRELNARDQIAAFIGGTLTGIVGAAFILIEEAGRDKVMRYIQDEALPFARIQAEGFQSTPPGHGEGQ